jgi:hypothetical protein
VDLNSLTAVELQNLCRQQGLRGWSKLRRSELIAFLQERGHAAEAPGSAAAPSLPYPPEASRTERLLLLLLRQLGTTTEAIDAAWWDPGPPKS